MSGAYQGKMKEEKGWEGGSVFVGCVKYSVDGVLVGHGHLWIEGDRGFPRLVEAA